MPQQYYAPQNRRPVRPQPQRFMARPAAPLPAAPPAPPPPAPVQLVPVPTRRISKCEHEHRRRSRAADIIEIVKVISYFAGPLAVAVGQFLVKKPARPPVTSTQTPVMIAENQNRYESNKLDYEMDVSRWTNIGQLLTTFGSSGLSKVDREEIDSALRTVMKKAL